MSSAGDTLSQGSWSSPPHENLLLQGTSIFTVYLTHFCSTPDTVLVVLIHYFHSLHSLIQQTSIVHPLCAKLFREAMRIKLALTSKKADVQEMTHPHSELSFWYMLDMRKGLQKVTKTGD